MSLVTRHEMVSTLLHAIAHPPDSLRIVEVPEIRHGP